MATDSSEIQHVSDTARGAFAHKTSKSVIFPFDWSDFRG